MSNFILTVPITAERIQEVIDVGLESEEYSSFVVIDDNLIQDKYGDSEDIFTLDTATRQRGLDILSKEFPLRALEILESQEDVVTADIYIQCCVYGECIYT